MGCKLTKQSSQLNDQAHNFIANILTRLLSSFSKQIYAISNKISQLRSKLNIQLNRWPSSRNLEVENLMVVEIVCCMNMKGVYRILEQKCKFVIENKQLLIAFTHKSASDHYIHQKRRMIKQPLQLILYSCPIITDDKISLKNADISKFQQLMHKHYPQITVPPSTSQELINFQTQHGKPTFIMVNQFVLNYCVEENVGLDKFRQIGHPYKF